MARIIGRNQYKNVLVEEDSGLTYEYSKDPIGLEFERNTRRGKGLVAFYYTERGRLVVFIHRSFANMCLVPGTYHVHLPIAEGKLDVNRTTLLVIPEEAVEAANI